MRYFRNHGDWIIHLAVQMSLEVKEGDVLRASPMDIESAKTVMRSIGVRIPGEDIATAEPTVRHLYSAWWTGTGRKSPNNT